MKNPICILSATCSSRSVCVTSTVATAQEAQVDRTELPIKGPWYPPITTLDARDAKAPPVFEVKAPKDAPNVVVILLDDLGFGGTGATGSVMPTPHFDKLAQNGLLYNQFHTTALCSPTRQALITGRNHHSCNQAKITEVATAFPGATGMLPNDVATHRRDAATERLQHGGVRQAARNGRLGDQSHPARSTAGRTCRASTSSTGSWAVKRISGLPRSITT